MTNRDAITYLKERDTRFVQLETNFGIPDFTPETNYFESLVRAIVYQQLSGKAANTIYKRFLNLFDDTSYPTPTMVLDIPFETLRSVGLSNQKSNYIINLSEHCRDEKLHFEAFNNMTDNEISHELIQVKGIGQWTVDMFLMFTLNRPDVFPLNDLGIQKGFMKFYKLDDLPSLELMQKESEQWKPYRTYVAWYMWKIVDGPFEW
jgi:DNA-3-methyladenine glycosylase II